MAISAHTWVAHQLLVHTSPAYLKLVLLKFLLVLYFHLPYSLLLGFSHLFGRIREQTERECFNKKNNPETSILSLSAFIAWYFKGLITHIYI